MNTFRFATVVAGFFVARLGAANAQDTAADAVQTPERIYFSARS